MKFCNGLSWVGLVDRLVPANNHDSVSNGYTEKQPDFRPDHQLLNMLYICMHSTTLSE